MALSWRQEETRMNAVLINKAAAAQRQIDASIRIMFSGEDVLAVRTVAAAGSRILRDLDRHRGGHFDKNKHETAVTGVFRGLIGRDPTTAEVEANSLSIKALLRAKEAKPTNFLKHADKDPDAFLDEDEDEVNADYLLLEACVLYSDLGFDPTATMWAFGRWHLAVYPSGEGDAVVTADSPVDEMPREHQLAFGRWLLEQQ
jgi:hypothetical protein